MIHTENLIIGAGPGGLQLAHDFKQLGRNYLVLEKAAQEGDFFTAYPRHRQLNSINKVYSDAESRDEVDDCLKHPWPLFRKHRCRKLCQRSTRSR